MLFSSSNAWTMHPKSLSSVGSIYSLLYLVLLASRPLSIDIKFPACRRRAQPLDPPVFVSYLSPSPSLPITFIKQPAHLMLFSQPQLSIRFSPSGFDEMIDVAVCW